jgi:micrococcal nuclease
MRRTMLLAAMALAMTVTPAEARHRRAPRREAPAAEAERPRVVTVRKVTDGDTIRVDGADGEEKVRVLGIDCPESARNAKCERDGRQGRHDCDWQVPRGVEAKRIARELLEGQQVTLEGPFSRDPYGRLLAYVRMADGQDYGLRMVREGRCEDFGWKYPHPRAAQYQGATPR